MYLKDQDGNIFESELLQEGCIIAIKEEINLSLLLQARNRKLIDLNIHYNSDILWSFTLYSTKYNCSLTKLQTWFLTHISTSVTFLDSKNKIINIDIDLDRVFNIITALNNIGLAILIKRNEIEGKISNAKDVDSLQTIDIVEEFNSINKTIDIDTV